MIDSELFPATDSMEAFLVHRTDPSLHLKLPETSLSQTTPLTIGRQAGAHLLIDEPSVSRRHAVISYINRQYMVQDLSSTNGTFVNNERVELAQPCIVQPNDILRFGNIAAFRFLLRPPNLGSQINEVGNQSYVLLPDETIARLRRTVQEQPVLNFDGTLSSPGIEQPVPASVVATFKEVPTLIILPPSGGYNPSPWVYLLKPNRQIAIGRGRGNTIELNDPVVSRRHAVLFLASNGCQIRDLGSSNGVIVNHIRIEHPHQLSHGDHIKLGETTIFFIDLQAGHEPTEKYFVPAPPITHQEQKASPIYNIMSSSLPETDTPYLTALANGALRISPASSSASESRLAANHSAADEVFTNDRQKQPTKRMTAVVANERKVAVVICLRCGIANTQVARFCASCSTLLLS
jgi:pSer/pThr/pTyr-binding forkhead associated (FHA) protein/ribosomal protein L40E